MNPGEVLEVLEARGAIQRGHFLLSSGRHSDVFVQKFRVFEDPRLTQRFGEEIAQAFAGQFEVVVSPAVGAIVLGFATALAADCRALFAERSEQKMSLRRGFALAPHERALVVEDVITTGGSAQEVVDLVRARGAVPIGVGALIDRSDPAFRFGAGVPIKALMKLETTSWDASACPLCREGRAVDDPGSRRL